MRRAASVGAAVMLAGASLLAGRSAHASPSRVAVLSPAGTPITERLERNVTSMSLSPVPSTVEYCTRRVVTPLLDELDADAALCADGDTVGVWIRDGDHVLLADVIVSVTADARGQELTAARATMVLRTRLEKKDAGPPAPITIVANGPSADFFAGTPAPAPIAADTRPKAPPPKPKPRLAPRLVLALGPAAVASRHGTSLAINASAELGFGRAVALVPWISFVPANRDVERPEGTASFRPTMFGLGFSMPFVDPSKPIIPRLGGGYALLWVHVAPESATAPAVMRKPEDLLAPVMYASTSLSVALTKELRVAAEAMGAIASHEMVIRIAREEAAHWGVPIGSLGIRGEWVLR